MTTPVGSIRFDLKIDGSKLAPDALAAVQKSLGPALADINRRLNEVEREYAAAGRSAEKSAAVQVASNRRVVESIDRETAAWQRLAAAKTAAAKAPTPSGPPSGGSGGGGGGSSGGGGGSSGGGGGGGGSFLTSPVGVNAIALGIGSLPAAAQVAGTLAGSLQQIAQVGLVLPGIYATVGASVGTAVLGFQGMKDAVTALNEAAASGDPKDLEKAAEALKGMAPAAAEVATSVSKLTQGPLKDLQKSVQQKMFAGVAGDIENLAGKAIPTLEKGFGGIADAWNATLKEVLRVGGSDSSLSIMDRIFGNTAEGQKRANAAIEPLVKGFGTLTAAGTDFIPRIADALTSVTTRFSNFITAADQDGRLAGWIDEALTGVGNLGETLLNVGKIFTSITEAAGGGDSFLQWLEDASTKLAKFLASDEGQAKLTNFFREGREQLSQWLPILQNGVTILGQVYEGAKQWSDVLLPALRGVTDLLTGMPDLVQSAVVGFLAFKTLGGIMGVAGGRAGTAFAGGFSGALSKIVLPAALLSVLNSQTQGMIGQDKGAKSNLGGLGLNVGGGALAGGLVAGAPGAIVGAVAGLGVSIYDRIKADIDKGRAEWESKWQADHDAGPNRPGSPQRQMDAVPAIKGTQLPSLFFPGGAPKPGQLQSVVDRIARGEIPGYTLGPGGAIIGPDGSTVSLPNMPAPSGLPAQLGPPLPLTSPVAPPLDLNKSLFTNPQDLSAELVNATELVKQLGDAINVLPSGKVVLQEDTPEAIKRVEDLGFKVQRLPEGLVVVDADTSSAVEKINALIVNAGKARLNIPVNVASTSTIGPNWGSADGGVLPGYSPGVDNMLWPMSGGEGVLIPEAVRGLGGSAAIYAINSWFRKGLSRRGYADGGTIPHLGTGLPPGPVPAGFPMIPTPGPQNPIPVYIVNGPGGGTSTAGQGSSPFAQALTDGVTRGAQDVAGTVLDDVTRGFMATFKGPVGPNTPRITKPEDADNLSGTIATTAGFTVADFSRRGGGASAQNLLRRQGPAFTASGQVFSDTSALLDRTLASLDAANQARHDQLMDVMNQVRDQLTERLLLPTMKTAVTEGIGAIGHATSMAIGQAMGQAAGPPIATAVGSAVRSNGAGGAGGIAAGVIAAAPGIGSQLGMAGGGGVYGGVAGRDSVPAMLMPGEFVLNTGDVARMGGIGGAERFRQALARTGGVRGFATGGGVSANETVGAEFFGVSEVPIISTIVNILVRVLLAVLGVNIEARDTLNEMTDEFRGFRGDAFKAFDATGRLLNDTSALLDRSSSSEETAAQERIRILKIVMEALIKYIIEKVIVPLAKAVVNSLLSFAGSAASSAITGSLGAASYGAAAPAGALLGNLASSLITGVGGAGVDVVAEVLASTAVELSGVMIDMIGDGLLSYFPGIMANAFGGGQVEQAIVGPLTSMLTDPSLGLFGRLFGGLQGLGGGSGITMAGGLFAPLLALLGGAAVFDDGGVARGVGLMPKAIAADEWMLSPQRSNEYQRTVELAHQLVTGRAGRAVEVHATIIMQGSQATPEAVRDRLLELI